MQICSTHFPPNMRKWIIMAKRVSIVFDNDLTIFSETRLVALRLSFPRAHNNKHNIDFGAKQHLFILTILPKWWWKRCLPSNVIPITPKMWCGVTRSIRWAVHWTLILAKKALILANLWLKLFCVSVTKELTVGKALLCYCHFLARICIYFENLLTY